MRIDSLAQLGAVLRETRVAQNIPLQDLAEVLNTSHTLLRRQEHGEPTKALKILFETMQQLGIQMHVELPPDIVVDVEKMREGVTRYSRARP